MVKGKMKVILQSITLLCDYFDPSAVAIKEVHPLRRSRNLKVLNEEIVSLLRKKKSKPPATQLMT